MEKESKEQCLLCPVCFNLLKISDFEDANQAAKSRGLQVRCKCGNASLIKFGLGELYAKVLSLAEKIEALKTSEVSSEKIRTGPEKTAK